MDPVQDLFTAYYEKNQWGDPDSRSGGGSNLAQTKAIRIALPRLFADYKIKSVLDIPCGDFHWMSQMEIGDINYTGADIVEKMIQNNNSRYGRDGRKFVCLDIIKDSLPSVDLILVRDCLVHLSFEQINSALRNIISSGSTYLCMTNFTGDHPNKDIHAGEWRPLNFIQKPFYFPEPIITIDEMCTENDGAYFDKTLGLWKISDLAKHTSEIKKSNRNQSLPLKNLFTYWHGPMPPLIKILIRLMTLHSKNSTNYSFKPLTQDSFLSEYNDAPDCFKLLSYAHQADVVRVWALNRHGGIWVDADTLIMNSLSSLFSLVEANNGFFITQNNQCLSNGVFGTKADTQLVRNWKSHIIDHLKSQGPNIAWEAIGNQYLTLTFNSDKKLFDGYTIFKGPQTMYPVNWDKCEGAFLSNPYWTHKHLIRRHQPLIILVNSVYKALSEFCELQILDSEYPLNYFINQSLYQLLSED